MKILTRNEATRQFPFIKEQFVQIGATRAYILDGPYCPLEFRLSALDDEFLDQSLLENQSEALGHFNVRKTLYLARGDRLHSVDARRSSTKIYHPEYLYGREFPPDESGWSENIREALSRQDLTEAQYIVLYTNGSNGHGKEINDLLIAPVKK